MNGPLHMQALAIGATAALFALTGCNASSTPSSPATSSQAQPAIAGAVFFGDSLTDAGTYGFRFTTMPGMTWAQHIAERLGQSTDSNEHLAYGDAYQGKPGIPGPGGLNYAEGGARANSAYSTVSPNPEGAPISTAVQVDRFLRQHRSFAPNQLVTLYVGTNDVAYNYDLAQNPNLAQSLRDNQTPNSEVMKSDTARVEQAALDEAKTASKILENGARHLLVFKLFDLGKLPWFRSDAARRYVHDLGAAYNQVLISAVPKDPRVQVIDTTAFVDDLLENGIQKGFTHGANDDACAKPDKDYCDGTSMQAPDADRTYIFAASEHMTTHANELLADYVLKQIGYNNR